MDLPGISVVIPVFNAAHWLPATLASVFAQTYPSERMEILLVDDGSTDGSAELAERMLSERTVESRVIRLENGGPSRARNIGWRAARYPWIQFLDADDLLAANKLRVQGEVAASTRDDSAVIYSPWQRCGAPLGALSRRGPITDPPLGANPLVNLIRADAFVATGSQLFSRAWLERVAGFDETIWLIEDVHLAIRIAASGGRFVRAPGSDPLFFYRERTASLSQRNLKEFLAGCLRNAQLVEAEALRRGPLTAYEAHVIAEVWFQAARQYAGTDWNAFESAVANLNRLVPGYLPSEPNHLRLAARALGYRRAERLAVLYRRLKSALKPNAAGRSRPPHAL